MMVALSSCPFDRSAEKLLHLPLSVCENAFDVRPDEPFRDGWLDRPAWNGVLHPVEHARPLPRRLEKVFVLPEPIRTLQRPIDEAKRGLPDAYLGAPQQRHAAPAQAVLDDGALTHR